MKNTFAIAMSVYAFGLMSGCATQPGRSASSPAPALTTEEQSSIKATVQELITSKKIPGAIVIVVQDGKAVFEDAAGASSANSTNPARMDTVIWLASMTKPIVATSILMLAEQGKLSIDDPVSKYIPEFAAIPKVKVAKPGAASPAQGSQPEFNLVDAKRTITIKDLLTHTSGLLPIGPGSVPKLGAADTLATAVPRLANVALSNQPGEKWGYSNSAGFDVLARIVEVVSGQNFKAFAQQHVLTPLGMKDTNWAPQTDARAPRMATSPTADGPNPTREGVTYFSGAAGLWGTLPDYSRFAQMLANGGALNGKRYLKPESVALMTRNHVGALYTGTNSGANGKPGFGFGLSVATVEDNAASGLAVPNRSFGWNGAGGTKFWVSPAEHKRILVMYAPNGEAQGRIEKAVDDALKD